MNAFSLLVLNGPNLDLTGIREPNIYGTDTLETINGRIAAYADRLSVSVEFLQSNNESELISALHRAANLYNGIILNAGALSHYSYALRDAISACELPVVEVHMSNVASRESFRHTSVIAPVCAGSIIGFGSESYMLALQYFTFKKKSLKQRK